ncbi:MAG: hypothetical protein MUF13_10590 [Akkermansiaceae bacterium]|nr:hypothetical protein [Akkermansiaceae bacterium]
MNPTPPPRIRLDVPRHLQDYNGYCGPACAMMVVAGESGSLPEALHAQQNLFREIRQHAKANNDKRPIKSPAESLIAVLHAHSRLPWRKFFDSQPRAIARRILDSIEKTGQPAIILVSKGMHWVVAFGRTLKSDGSVAGVLLRDPAWAGMPKFFGLTIYPEKATFVHSAAPCKCLNADRPPASVHERYIAMDELLSPRGLHGSPDWEGNGAIAIIPDSETTEQTAK